MVYVLCEVATSTPPPPNHRHVICVWRKKSLVNKLIVGPAAHKNRIVSVLQSCNTPNADFLLSIRMFN